MSGSNMRVSIEVTADNRQAVAAIAGVKQEVEKLAPAGAAAGQAAGAGIKQVGDAAGNAAPALVRMGSGLRDTEAAARGAGQAVAITGNQMRQLAPQINDIATQLALGQSPFMILAAQGGQITQVFGGVRNTLAALASFLGPAGIAGILGVTVGGSIFLGLERDARALNDLSQRLRATRSDAAGLAREVDQAAQNVSQSSGVGRGDAREAGRIIAGQRNFSGDRAEIEGLIRLSADLARVMGVDVTQAADQFVAKAIRDPAAAAREAAAGGLLGFNDALRRQVELLAASGDRAGAARLTLDQYGRAAAGAAQDLTDLQELWQRVSNAMSAAADAASRLGNFVARNLPGGGATSTISPGTRSENSLASAEDQLRRFDAETARYRDRTTPTMVTGFGYGSVEELRRPLVEMVELMRADRNRLVSPGLRGQERSPELERITATSNTREVREAVAAEARRQGVPEALALAVAQRENGFSFLGRNGEVARSPVGALGTMQLMPRTAAGLGVDPTNPQENILGGVKYLRQLLDMPAFQRDPTLVGGAYNAGPGRISAFLRGEGPPLAAETLRYAAAMPGGGRLADAGRAVVSADQASQGSDANDYQRRLLNRRITTLREGMAALDPDSEEAKRYLDLITQLQSQLANLDTPIERSARALRDQSAAFSQNAGAARDLAQAQIQAQNAARDRGLSGGQADTYVAQEMQAARGRLADRFRQDVNERTQAIEVQRAGLGVAEQGAAAVERETIAQQARNIALRNSIQGTSDYAEQVRTLIPLLTVAASTPRISSLLVEQAQQRDRLALDNELIGASATERAQRTAGLRARERLGAGADTPEGQSAITGARALAANQVELERTQAAYNEFGRVGEQAVDRIGQAITSGTLSLKDMGRIGLSVASELTQAFFRLAVINPLKNLAGGNAPTLGDVGGVLSRLLGGGNAAAQSAAAAAQTQALPSVAQIATPGFFNFFHGGGIVGGTPTFTRPVNDNLFIGAPRFHDGGILAPDEVPAILQRGEGVFTAEQMAALGRGDHLGGSAAGGGNTINFHMPVNFSGDSGSKADQQALLGQMRAQMLSVIAEAMPDIARSSHQYTMGEISRGGNAARVVGRR